MCGLVRNVLWEARKEARSTGRLLEELCRQERLGTLNSEQWGFGGVTSHAPGLYLAGSWWGTRSMHPERDGLERCVSI